MNGRTSLSLSFAVLAGVAFALTIPTGIFVGHTPCKKPWVFFDLGNTVIASNPGQESRYLPGAHSYIQELQRRGFQIGLITNVPEKWGRTRSGRIRALKKIVNETWTTDASAERMNWEDFPETHIFVPGRDADRKPSPYLFSTALAAVSLEEGQSGCPVVFQGEDPREVATAEKLGMKGYIIGRDPAALYLPLDQLESR